MTGRQPPDAREGEPSPSEHVVVPRSFRHVQAGDTVLRLLAGVIPMELLVTAVDDQLIWCGPVNSGWAFDRDTGVEVDEELGWGPAFGITGSYLVDPTLHDA